MLNNTTTALALPSSAEPTPLPTLADNTTALLQGLMTGFGWRDQRDEILAAEAEHQTLGQNMQLALTDYLEEPDEAHQARLVSCLQQALAKTQAEITHALQQQAYYRAQAAREAQETSRLSFLGWWPYGVLESVKHFFGSTTGQLIEKYTELASQRQEHQQQLQRCLEALDKEKARQFEYKYELQRIEMSPMATQDADAKKQSLLSTSNPAVFPAVISLASLGVYGFKLDGETAGDSSGLSVSRAGDVNGDGYADVLIGAFGHASSGRSYVVFGGADVSSSGLLPLSSLNGSNGFIIDGETTGDWSGWSVSSAGDVNGDRYADVLIGAVGHATWTGRSYVVFGGPSVGSNGLLPLSSLNGSNGFKLDGEATADESGYSVSSAGDVNGDGYADVLIVAIGHASNTGRSYVVFGEPSVGSNGLLPLSSLNGSNGFKLDGEAAGDFSGWFVSSAGDVNGDGYADVLIGAPKHDTNTGRSYVVLGGPGVGSGGLLALSSLNGSNGFILDGEATNDNSGYSVSSAGDVNGDGYADVLIGALGHANYTGRNYVVFGGPSVGSSGLLPLSSLNGSNGFTLDGEAVGDHVGISVSSAGDVNGDGYADILIGANYRAISIGRSYVVFGGPSVGSSGSLPLSSLNGSNGFKLDGEAMGDYSGQSVNNAGDINGDGYADVLIGAYHHASDTGRSYVVFGDTCPDIRVNQLTINQGETSTLTASHLNVTGMPTFTVSNMQHGRFELLSHPGQAVTRFNQSQIFDQQIQFIHDGSPIAPSYTLQATARTVTCRQQVAAAVNVTFYRRPVWLANQLTIIKGGTALMTPAQLDTSSDYPDAEVTFTVSTSHGQFEFILAGNLTTQQFTQQHITNGQIQFRHDGGDAAPSYNITMHDGFFSLGPASGNVSYSFMAHPPRVNRPLPPLAVEISKAIYYPIPPDTFVDPNGYALELAMALAGGQGLPKGLYFDVPTATLSGFRNQEDEFNLSVTATNTVRLSTTTYFTLQIGGIVPPLSASSLDIKTLASALGSVGGFVLTALVYVYRRYHFKRKREIEHPFANAIHERLNLAYPDFLTGDGEKYAQSIDGMITLLRQKNHVDLEALQHSTERQDRERYEYYADLFAAIIPRYAKLYWVYCGTSCELRLRNLDNHKNPKIIADIVDEVITRIAEASAGEIHAARQRSWCGFFSPCCASRGNLNGSDFELTDKVVPYSDKDNKASQENVLEIKG